MPVNDAVKSIMQMPGSRAAEGISFSGRIKQISRTFHIGLKQVSESEISFSDTFGWPGAIVVTGDLIFKRVSSNKTQATAIFRLITRASTMSIRWRKIVIWVFLLLIPVAAWFLNGELLDRGIKKDISLKITTIASLLLLITGPIFSSLVLWWASKRIKIFLTNFSEALGVGDKWI